MYNLKLISVLLLIVVCFSNCQKPCKVAYNFDFPFTISPANDTISIGDTLTIESIYDSQLLDKNSNEYIQVNYYDFHFDFFLTKLDSINKFPYDYFDIIVVKGEFNTFTYSDGHKKKKKIYSYENNKNYFKISLIAQEKGIFYIRQYPYITGAKYDDLNITDTECEESVDDFNIITNGGQDNHYYLLSYSTDLGYKNALLSDFTKTGGFCFVVK